MGDALNNDLTTTLLENYVLLNAAVEHQNIGKFQDMLRYQEKLHDNIHQIMQMIELAPALAFVMPSSTPQPTPALHPAPPSDADAQPGAALLPQGTTTHPRDPALHPGATADHQTHMMDSDMLEPGGPDAPLVTDLQLQLGAPGPATAGAAGADLHYPEQHQGRQVLQTRERVSASDHAASLGAAAAAVSASLLPPTVRQLLRHQPGPQPLPQQQQQQRLSSPRAYGARDHPRPAASAQHEQRGNRHTNVSSPSRSYQQPQQQHSHQPYPQKQSQPPQQQQQYMYRPEGTRVAQQDGYTGSRPAAAAVGQHPPYPWQSLQPPLLQLHDPLLSLSRPQQQHQLRAPSLPPSLMSPPGTWPDSSQQPPQHHQLQHQQHHVMPPQDIWPGGDVVSGQYPSGPYAGRPGPGQQVPPPPMLGPLQPGQPLGPPSGPGLGASAGLGRAPAGGQGRAQAGGPSGWMGSVNAGVGSFLLSLGLGRYEDLLEENGVDMAALQLMTEQHLRDLGLPIGAVVKIKAALSSR